MMCLGMFVRDTPLFLFALVYILDVCRFFFISVLFVLEGLVVNFIDLMYFSSCLIFCIIDLVFDKVLSLIPYSSILLRTRMKA